MQCKDLPDLMTLFRNDGESLFNGMSKLSLSTSLLSQLNEGLNSSILHTGQIYDFDVVMLKECIQKTLGLKVFNDFKCSPESLCTDLYMFTNIKLIEVQRLGAKFLSGLNVLRSQLEFMTFMRSIKSLSEVLEYCGADSTNGEHWPELKTAIFSHNQLNNIDGSLVLAPSLRCLDLSNNILQNIDNINYLGNLAHLNLANNKIQQLPQFSKGICDNLETLILKNNFIEDIEQLGCLTKLRTLDISNNILIYLDSLMILNIFHDLNKLKLMGNPMSYVKNYRIQVCKYLSDRINSKSFKFDEVSLSARELRVVNMLGNKCLVDKGEQMGSSHVITMPNRRETIDTDMPSFGSYNSNTTATTVIECNYKRPDQTSDMEVSATSIEPSTTNDVCQLQPAETGLQDSGISTGRRPASPDSIGSASSLHERALPIDKNHSESDIEILSNPSQSSIEVLYSANTPICVQSAILMPFNLPQMCADKELRKLWDEMHRSL